MKKIYLVIIGVLAVLSFQAQSFNKSKNVIFTEVFGNGVVVSINYDTRLSGRFGLRGGLGFSGFKQDDIWTLPLLANYLIGKGNHFLEVGAGIVYINGLPNLEKTGINEENKWFTSFSCMYRYQPEKEGIMFKIGLTPAWTEDGFQPLYGGIGVGYAF